RDLTAEFAPEFSIMQKDTFYFGKPVWNVRNKILAFTAAPLDKEGEPEKALIYTWQPGSEASLAIDTNAVAESFIPADHTPEWNEKKNLLYFGIKNKKYEEQAEKVKFTDSTFYNIDSIMANSDLIIWHHDDPRIKPNEIKEWPQKKKFTGTAVYNPEDNSIVRLTAPEVREVHKGYSDTYTYGTNDKPYLKGITYKGWFRDVYSVDIRNAERKKIAEAVQHSIHASPFGKYIIYFKEKDWHIYDNESGQTRNLTDKMAEPFWDVDHDIPALPGSYGIGGWYEDDSHLILYDKFDIWKVDPATGEFQNLTNGYGRENNIQLRLINEDRDRHYYKGEEKLIVNAYHDKLKYTALYKIDLSTGELTKKLQDNKRYAFRGKAKDADVVLITRESFDEFPDIRVTDMSLENPKKITNLGIQLDDYIWGKTELIDWQTAAGDTLQGYIIKPDNYKEGRRYPVMIYFYEKFSQRMYNFPQPKVNHRPDYPMYLGEGYVIFLPDIKYGTGNPGYDATDALVSGSQKLIDLGIADPEAIGLQGHSWAGYQSAFVITQTDMFAAVVSGAPVGNMTSAYSGIRLGTGLARQFQYELFQSRIGGTLWNSLDNYIRNSPVFLADKINTPMMIMFGNEDDAVPYEQGIELFLAMRRLNKNVIMLEYENEPHHLHKYSNRMDYSYRMKQYFDHFLLGKPAPSWMKEGEPYIGK
ncbi:MAG: prolyl oligopeptidase family serine peptidase, partial [Bacteroidota bacterium]